MEAYLHFCVRKSISKRKQRFYTKSIKITISCINSFLVLFSFKLAIKIAVFLCTRIILIPSGPCCSQLAAWSYLSQKDIGEGKSASLSKLGNIQDSTDIFCFFTARIFFACSKISVSSTGPPEFRISTIGIFCASRNRISSCSRLLR